MADPLEKNTLELMEKELRVYFYDVLGRAPSRGERSFIRELIQERRQGSDQTV